MTLEWKAIFNSWLNLPEETRQFLAPEQSLFEQCFEQGMSFEIQRAPGIDVTEDIRKIGSSPALWNGGGAIFIPPIRKYVILESLLVPGGQVALGYPPGYRPGVHELGHAVWYLLLTTQERWMRYHPVWAQARDADRLLNEYSYTTVAEGFAEDFEAITRDDWADPASEWGALDGAQALRKVDPVRYDVLAKILERVGANVHG